MKKYILLTLVISLAVLIIANIQCGGGSSSSSSGSSGGGNEGKITLKGTLNGGIHARIKHLNRFDRLLADLFSRPLYALTAADVVSVMVFNINGQYSTTTLDDNDNFSIMVDPGYPTGLVFLGAGNTYLGYLTLTNGIDCLPLVKIDDSVTLSTTPTIDLQALSSSGLVVDPGHNPVGTELPLTAEEQTALAQGDDYFASIIKQVDIDNNGNIDLLESRFYRPFIQYFVESGSFGSGQTPTVITPAGIIGFRFNASIYEQGVVSFPSTVTFTGPAGSGLSGVVNDAAPHLYTNNALYGSPYVDSPVIPPVGAYTVTYLTRNLVFNIPAQTSAISNIVLAVPTVSLTGGSAIEVINWVYKLGDGSSTAIDPVSLIKYMNVQINGTGTQYDPTYPQGATRLYNSASFAPATLTMTLPLTDSSGAPWTIPWANVTNIGMAYDDIYGNHYVVGWDKP